MKYCNGAALPQSGKAGGQMSHSYTYDALYRLSSATGTYTGADGKTAGYTLSMGYDNMHRITSKSQHLTQANLQFDGTLNVGYDLTYTYGQEEGKKFQLANVSDVNYRKEATPDENQKTRNSHAYEYDANGNLVYVNTGRVKKDETTDEKAHERKLKWDEENRLLASDDDGFVTNYWYDADGERTVKTSGESEQVYVNSGFAGGRTSTARFSLYVSPYLVANQGGRYTKHIYIGGERIVSKIGDFASYGPDPRRIEYAGSEADAVTVDYDVKYSQQLQAIKDNYATFGVPYNGTDNDDYVNGEGFCCNDGSLEAAQAEAVAKANALDGNFQEGDTYENLQFYYHADHLGSTSYITNLDGEVVQHVEYVPFGEVFIEERNNTWNTPYLFNAKEFDEETGLYYYGARYYDPRLSLWMSTDPMQEKYPNFSSYCYVIDNPVKLIDPDGKDSYLIIWASQSDAYGHAAFGVDNYVWSTEQNKYVSDGTITVFGLFPINGYSSEQAKLDERVRGLFLIDRKVTLNELKKNKFYSGENADPDGILRISSDYQTDQKTKEVLQTEIDSNKGYKGMSRNCSTFAREGVRNALGNNIKGEESFLGKTYVTPNKLFEDAKIFPNTEIVVDPGKKTNYKFSETIKSAIKQEVKERIK